MTQVMSNPGLAAQREILTDVVPGGTFTIGERQFAARKLKVGPFLAVGDLVMTEIQQLVEDGTLDVQTLTSLRPDDLPAIVRLIVKLWRRAPGVVEQLLGLIFGVAPDDAATRAFIMAELDLDEVPHVIEAFFAVNPWQDLVASFFRIGQQIAGAFPHTGPTTS